MNKQPKDNIVLRPDSRGRINLGSLSNGVSGFQLNITAKGLICLQPLTEIPIVEPWFEHDETVVKELKESIENVKKGNVVSINDCKDILEDLKNV